MHMHKALHLKCRLDKRMNIYELEQRTSLPDVNKSSYCINFTEVYYWFKIKRTSRLTVLKHPISALL